jgi:hypothetical protein
MRKWILLSVVFLLAATLPLFGQSRVNIDLPGLADRAAETTEVTLDASTLRLASRFLGDDDRDVRDIVKNLQAIYVRSYKFDHENEYDRATIERLRGQLGASWKRIVQVKSRDGDNADIYVDMRDDRAQGLLIIAAEPKELTLVNLVGPIDVEKLSSIEGQFGIPRVTARGKAKEERSHE